ncbi:MAG: SPOR domain-containing protein [Deltaproteobacteria bacterium]|nr:SPOR domain-containing protein [Deltaproteobacteria bacterium]
MIFFASGFMFFIGVLVGRNTAPIHFDKDSLEQQLVHLQRSVLDKSSVATAAIEDKLQKHPVFDFYDKLKEKTDHKGAHVQTPVKKPKYQKPGPMALALASRARPLAGPEPVPKTGPDVGSVIRTETEKETKPQAIAETKIAALKTVPLEQAPETAQPVKAKPVQKQELTAEVRNKPAPGKKPVYSGRKYAIQVASLKDTRSAESIRNKFRSKGYPAYIQEAIVQGRGQWFRVRIGPYSDKSQAASDLSRLQQAGVDAILFLSDTGVKRNTGGKNENNKG